MNALTARMAALKPRIKGEWMPIYFEPIFMSGERLTIAIAAVSELGDVAVFNTIEKTMLKQMYKNRAAEIIGLIDLVTDSLSEFVTKHRKLNFWQSPITGVDKGNVMAAEGVEFKHIVNQGIRSCSSLSQHLYDDPIEEVNNERVTTAVKQYLVSRNKEYKKYINQVIDLNDARKRKYNVANPNYAANIITAVKGSHAVNSGLVKLLNLNDLKSDQLSAYQEYGIIVTKPFDKSIDTSVVKQIQDEAARYKLGCVVIDNQPEAVADYIHEKVKLVA